MSSFHRKTPPEIPGYEITRLIGLGGMGEVYLARQLVLNRPVAIKFLTKTAGDPTDEYEVRFRREAELMARVSHPNVVTIFDFGTIAGRPYLVMEYIENGDLRSRMVPDVAMPVEEIRTIMRPVFRAMEYLHRQGIVHRDMKPENILMHSEETPKVTDFGIAVLDFAIGSLTRTGLSLGTPGYVAPEQQFGLKVNERADQFSLAALCYEMATGRKPLGSYPPPSKLNPKIGPKASDAIMKALSEDANDRFPTIGEFGKALDLGLVQAPPRKPTKLHAALMVGLVTVLLLAGAIGRYLGANPDKKVVDQGPTAPQAPTSPQAQVQPPPAAEIPLQIHLASINMTLNKVPAGEFWMGSPTSDPAAETKEFPRHLVRIVKPFYMGEKEVTVAQFRAFVEAKNNYKTVPETKGSAAMFNTKTLEWQQRPDLNWRNPGSAEPQKDDEPVVQVSWSDAVEFCKWLSLVENRTYRLPTEAEWEYACRAMTTTRWCSGDTPESVDLVGWTVRNSDFVFHKVGTKRPNPWGLFDMHGNVWEWCADWYGPYTDAVLDDPIGPEKGEGRVIRGGSFDWTDVEKTRSASRMSYSPDMSYYNYGFRVCSPMGP